MDNKFNSIEKIYDNIDIKIRGEKSEFVNNYLLFNILPYLDKNDEGNLIIKEDKKSELKFKFGIDLDIDDDEMIMNKVFTQISECSNLKIDAIKQNVIQKFDNFIGKRYIPYDEYLMIKNFFEKKDIKINDKEIIEIYIKKGVFYRDLDKFQIFFNKKFKQNTETDRNNIINVINKLKFLPISKTQLEKIFNVNYTKYRTCNCMYEIITDKYEQLKKDRNKKLLEEQKKLELKNIEEKLSNNTLKDQEKQELEINKNIDDLTSDSAEFKSLKESVDKIYSTYIEYFESIGFKVNIEEVEKIIEIYNELNENIINSKQNWDFVTESDKLKFAYLCFYSDCVNKWEQKYKKQSQEIDKEYEKYEFVSEKFKDVIEICYMPLFTKIEQNNKSLFNDSLNRFEEYKTYDQYSAKNLKDIKKMYKYINNNLREIGEDLNSLINNIFENETIYFIKEYIIDKDINELEFDYFKYFNQEEAELSDVLTTSYAITQDEESILTGISKTILSCQNTENTKLEKIKSDISGKLLEPKNVKKYNVPETYKKKYDKKLKEELIKISKKINELNDINEINNYISYTVNKLSNVKNYFKTINDNSDKIKSIEDLEAKNNDFNSIQCQKFDEINNETTFTLKNIIYNLFYSKKYKAFQDLHNIFLNINQMRNTLLIQMHLIAIEIQNNQEKYTNDIISNYKKRVDDLNKKFQLKLNGNKIYENFNKMIYTYYKINDNTTYIDNDFKKVFMRLLPRNIKNDTEQSDRIYSRLYQCLCELTNGKKEVSIDENGDKFVGNDIHHTDERPEMLCYSKLIALQKLSHQQGIHELGENNKHVEKIFDNVDLYKDRVEKIKKIKKGVKDKELKIKLNMIRLRYVAIQSHSNNIEEDLNDRIDNLKNDEKCIEELYEYVNKKFEEINVLDVSNSETKLNNTKYKKLLEALSSCYIDCNKMARKRVRI